MKFLIRLLPLAILPPLLWAGGPAPAKPQEITPLYVLDVSEFPIGTMNNATLKEASQSGNSLMPVTFQIRDKDLNANANIVELDGKVKALRLNVPALVGGVDQSYPVALYFNDNSLGDHIDQAKPLYLEIQVQRRGAPIHFSVTALFRPAQPSEGSFVQAGLGVVATAGNYQAIKTPLIPNPEREEGPDFPSEQTTTLRYEFTQGPTGISVKTKILVGKEAVFETLDPAQMADKKLDEMAGLWLMAMHYPNMPETGEDSIDVISIKAWQ